MNPLLQNMPRPAQNPGIDMNKFNQFASMVQGNPQAIVQNLINSGKMSQEQFNQYAAIANRMTGRG